MKPFGKIGMSLCDKERYTRQMMMPEVGEKGQKMLSTAKVLVIGAGGLGSPILMYLAGAGVGQIGVIDDDKVSLSNLQRQIFYKTNEIGQSKSTLMSQNITDLNPDCQVKTFAERLDETNVKAIIADFDIVVDACDNYETRYMVDDICAKLSKPYVYGSVAGFNGQVGVFNYNGSCSYTAVFPYDDTQDFEHHTIGVLGSMPAIIASIQTTEVLKIILQQGDVLYNQLLLIDVLQMTFTKLPVLIR